MHETEKNVLGILINQIRVLYTPNIDFLPLTGLVNAIVPMPNTKTEIMCQFLAQVEVVLTTFATEKCPE